MSSNVDTGALSINDLQALFSKILESKFTIHYNHELTLFDISGFPHYEDVSSNWYAFFLNPKKEHGLNELFIDSLIEIINEKKHGPVFTIDEFEVHREYLTRKGNFIDLVIQDGGPGARGNAIIIENKVRASLYNDLNDYYDSIEADNKIGIVLTLNTAEDLSRFHDREYVNITHLELLRRVSSNLGRVLLSANEKYLILLKDFIFNFEKMSTVEEMPDSVKFHFDNGEKIQSLIDLKSNSESFLSDSLFQAISSSKWTWHKKNPNTFSLTLEETPLWGYVYFNKLFNARQLNIKIWIKGKDHIDNWNSHNLQELRDRWMEKLPISDQNPDSKEWLLLTQKEYSDFKLEQIESFGSFVVSELEDVFEPLIDEVKGLL